MCAGCICIRHSSILHRSHLKRCRTSSRATRRWRERRVGPHTYTHSEAPGTRARLGTAGAPQLKASSRCTPCLGAHGFSSSTTATCCLSAFTKPAKKQQARPNSTGPDCLLTSTAINSIQESLHCNKDKWLSGALWRLQTSSNHEVASPILSTAVRENGECQSSCRVN